MTLPPLIWARMASTILTERRPVNLSKNSEGYKAGTRRLMSLTALGVQRASEHHYGCIGEVASCLPYRRWSFHFIPPGPVSFSGRSREILVLERNIEGTFFERR